MMPPSSSPPVMRTDKKYRMMVIFLLLGAVAIGIGLILFTNTYIHELEQVAQHAPEEALMNTSLLLLGITMLAGLPAVGIGTYVIYLGHRIRITEQIPPPGTRVVVDTTVIKGKAARVRGIVLMVLGGLVILCGLGLPIVFWKLMQTV